jgi:hypothetical protein
VEQQRQQLRSRKPQQQQTRQQEQQQRLSCCNTIQAGILFHETGNKREQNSPGHILPDKKGEYRNRGAVLSIASLRKVPLHLF